MRVLERLKRRWIEAEAQLEDCREVLKQLKAARAMEFVGLVTAIDEKGPGVQARHKRVMELRVALAKADLAIKDKKAEVKEWRERSAAIQREMFAEIDEPTPRLFNE
jgi:hypothetical protein